MWLLVTESGALCDSVRPGPFRLVPRWAPGGDTCAGPWPSRFSLRASALTAARPPSVAALPLKGARPGRDGCHTTTLCPKAGRRPPSRGHLSLPLTSPGPAFHSVLTAPAVFTANQPVFSSLSDLKPGLTPQLTGAAALLPALGHQPLRAPVTEGMTDLAGTQGPRL